MNTAQAFQVLQLRPSSSFVEIKYAYRKLALELHPDKNNAERDGTKFRLATEAYHFLKNSNKAINSKIRDHATAKYAETEKEKTFSRTGWGARPGDRPPEENWEKYTRQTEQSDPFFWKKFVSEFWKEYEAEKSKTEKPYDFEITQEKEQDLFVHVEHSQCIGCCSCETIAPQVFCVDKHSKMNPKSSVINQKGAKTEKIMDAAQTCPTKAIKIDEQKTGRRLYPY